jgi:hypothetical protein
MLHPRGLPLAVLRLVACAEPAGKGPVPEPVFEEVDADTDTDTDTDTDDRTVGGQTLCGGGGRVSSGTHTAITGLAPVEVARTAEASDGAHTLYMGPIRRVSP